MATNTPKEFENWIMASAELLKQISPILIVVIVNSNSGKYVEEFRHILARLFISTFLITISWNTQRWLYFFVA